MSSSSSSRLVSIIAQLRDVQHALHTFRSGQDDVKSSRLTATADSGALEKTPSVQHSMDRHRSDQPAKTTTIFPALPKNISLLPKNMLVVLGLFVGIFVLLVVRCPSFCQNRVDPGSEESRTGWKAFFKQRRWMRIVLMAAALAALLFYGTPLLVQKFYRPISPPKD